MRCDHALAATVMFLATGLTPAVMAQDFAQIRTMAGSVADRMKQSGRKTIAVVDFTDLRGSVTELGRFLAEEFSVALASSDGIETIDRTHLKAIMAEHKLSASGIIDPQTARKLGRVAGVETLLTATLTPFGDSVRVALKLLDTNTARVVTASSADIPRTKAIDELLNRSLGRAAAPGLPSASGTEPDGNRRAQSASNQVTAGGFIFELQGCRGSAPVTCHFLVTASEDNELGTAGHPPSRVFDTDGNELRVHQLLVGNRLWNNTVVADVRTRLTVSFLDTSGVGGRVRGEAVGGGRPGTPMLSLIELKLRNRSAEFTVQFRNVPVQ